MYNAKYILVNILQYAAHGVYYRSEVLAELETCGESYSTVAIKLEDLYDNFKKDSTLELQMLNYLDANVYRRKSAIKNMIKLFISYNSSKPLHFSIPSDSYINRKKKYLRIK